MMLRAIRVFVPFTLVAVAACAQSATSGTNALQPLTAITQEAAGAECPAGGLRITTGLDANESGALDPDEVTSSQVVCNGKSGGDGATGAAGAGGSALVNVAAEAAGANCAAGGTRIETGPDADGNGTLDASEVKATRYVCNGASGGSATDAVTKFFNDNVNVQDNTNSKTILSATIAAPGAGKVIAIASADTFCAKPALSLGYDCAASGETQGYYTLTTDPSGAADTGQYDFFSITPNATENTTRTAVFDVAAAGNVTVNIRARTNVAGHEFAFFRTSLTLVYLP